jgi:hypothetical protein
MDEGKIIFETSLVSPGIRLISISNYRASCGRKAGGLFTYVTKKPTSLVVVSSLGRKAFRVSGEEVALEQFVGETPGLKEILEGL